MNENLKTIFDFIQQNENLTADDKNTLSKAVKDVDKELTVTAFKLDRTEKVKRTTAILLEETIEELEQKRKAVEAQNRELEIEAALERVRSRSLLMNRSEELKEVVAVLFQKLQDLGFGIDEGAAIVMTFSPGSKSHTQWIADAAQTYAVPFHIPFTDYSISRDQTDAREQGLPFYAKHYTQKEKNEYFRYLFEHTEYRQVPNDVQEMILDSGDFGLSVAFEKNSAIAIPSTVGKLVTGEKAEILKRFARVFEQTYTRFLDLQKAEVQTREAKIEAALERVRSRSMAMHDTADLSAVVYAMFTELVKLDAQLDRCLILIVNPQTLDITWHLTGKEGLLSNNGFLVPDNPHPSHQAYLEGWRTRRKKWNYLLSGEEKRQWDAYGFSETGLAQLPDFIKADMSAVEAIHLTISSDEFGCLIASSLSQLSDAHAGIVDRFTTVFNQTYTRFLDLQKAEAQAREAQIEAALEKVRSTSLAIHQSQELEKVVVVLFEKLKELEVPFDTTFIYFFDKPQKNIEAWVATKQLANPLKVYMPYEEEMANNPIIADLWYALENGEDGLNKCYKGKEKDDYYRYEAKHNKSVIPEDITNFCIQAESWTTSFATEENSIMGFDSWSGQQIKEDEFKILKRFAKVFEQAYMRFLDLQKSEAHARESQIQLALERVRAKTMAMQHSGELREIAAAVHDQLLGLGFTSGFCSIVIMDRITGDMTWWMFFPGKEYPESYHMPFCEHPFYLAQLNRWKQGEKYSVIEVSGEEKKSYDKYTFGQTEFKNIPIESQQFMMSFEKIIFSNAYMKHGAFSWGVEPIDNEHAAVLQRFASVFEQCYTRFLDLQKAEAQSREAHIEASLERLRSKTMAMHNSHDVGESVAMLFDELVALAVLGEHDRCGIGIMQPHESMEAWTASKTEDGKAELTIGHLVMKSHPLLQGAYNGWIDKKETFQYVLEGEDKLNYYEAIRNQADYKINRDYYSEPVRIVHTDFYFKEGCLYVFSQKEFSTESTFVFVRFAGVFGQTYRRYLDLQKAEAQALEAIKRASVDRVRAEIASMRTKQDLERITPLIWKELTTLGIPFVRCGVFIMDEQKELIHTFLSTPEGKAIAAFHLPYNSNPFFKAIDEWRAKKIHITHWDISEFATMADYLVKDGQVATREQYLSTVPQVGLYLHYIPFLQGILYVGNSTSLIEDKLHLVQSVADAFSTAYARYEDFNKLEAAKKQVDITLVELKSTQAQLIQSEKMASLGELTAGIAHEIQNPLNFVNNFSEVSVELLTELKEELEKGDIAEASLISEDVIQNLSKIHHHGQRASDIVKGMLLHSRTSSGQKEPTDINALADEYLRLAYHGLRAKDKSLNAEFKTELDSSLPKINVVGQDIGRVLLNLINNAFYAVTQKAKRGIDEYKPVVVVQTKKRNNTMEIKVKDNGDGIPAHVLNKIFQPFFTTKPTGQGTGLGLSLSYDIVTKGHNGSLEVDTTEGVGTEFIVQLPIV